MANEGKFCVRCGAMIPEGSSFCGECGLSIDPNVSGNTEPGNRINNDTKKLGAVPVCILLYGIMTVVLSLFTLYFVLTFDNMIAMLMEMVEHLPASEQQQMLEFIEQLLAIFTESAKQVYIVMTCLLIISGICAIISSYCAGNSKNWKAAVGFCAVATVLSIASLGLITIVLVIVGAYMTYRLYQSKDLFVS